MQVTFFKSKGNGKVPISPYDDNTFLFQNKSFNSLKNIFEFMQDNYVMSVPLNLKEPVRTYKRIENLKDFKVDKLEYIILDIDEIKTKENFEKVLNFFNEKNFNMILGKSRSFNSKTNFNLKGLIKVNFPNNKDIVKNFLTVIQNELKCCKIDKTVITNQISHQAPINNYGIFLYNKNGKIITEQDVVIKETSSSISDFLELNKSVNDKLLETCLNIFYEKGFTPRNKFNSNGSLNFKHPSEKTPYGYFWYPNNPFVMHHPVQGKSFSIFNEIKETEVGKEFIKDISIQKQKEVLDTKKVYKKQLVVNERYLKVQNKKDFIDDYLKNGEILKIKSPMGTGKSNIIGYIIKELKKQNKKVLLISNRISVAKDFAEKYDLPIYLDKNNRNFDNIVVQFDSLYKYNVNDYDYVILDEFISLLFHHRNNLTSFSNINAAKFYYILQNKKIVIADAFLTGYEDIFIPEKRHSKIFQIENIYRENVKLFEYKDKNFFISTLIDKALSLKENEFLTSSFLSMNTLKAVELILKEQGIKVVSLTSETSEITKELIFKKFKEENHNSFKVVLYTPTLTVGVSNLNNVKYHFHYDTGMSADVISSLQMIKRSRKAKEIHFYLEEKQFYNITNDEQLNLIMEKNINEFYIKKDKTLLVDFDYGTGELSLTPLSKYLNKIEAFYNIFENNHKKSFEILLKNQFYSNIEVIDFKEYNFNINDIVKKIKEKEKEEKISLIKKFSNVTWDPEEIDELKSKFSEKTDEEKVKILFGEIQTKFKKQLTRDELIELAKKEILTNFNYINKIKNYHLLNSSDDYTKYLISKIISENVKDQNLKFLKFLLKFQKSKIELKDSYSPKEIKEFANKLGTQTRFFEDFLKNIGYNWTFGKLRFDKKILEYQKYL